LFVGSTLNEGDAKVLIGPPGCHTATWGAVQEAKLQQKWLVDILNRVDFLGQCGGERRKANWPAME
jgi:hypothetical protein